MWNEFDFMEAARAAYIAYVLKNEGYQVKWNPIIPETIEVFGDRKKLTDFIKHTRGTDNEWYLKPQIVR